MTWGSQEESLASGCRQCFCSGLQGVACRSAGIGSDKLVYKKLLADWTAEHAKWRVYDEKKAKHSFIPLLSKMHRSDEVLLFKNFDSFRELYMSLPPKYVDKKVDIKSFLFLLKHIIR